jgi:ATP-dependent Lhr-like helicase
VSRDWWRRERPPVAWRDIYHELTRLEFRGEVRRGYFVAGLAGAQFALPEAVELLRAPIAADEPVVVFTTSDPANAYALPVMAGTDVDPLARPRGVGALIATRAGRIILTAEGRGRRLRVRSDAAAPDVRDAARVLAERLLVAPGLRALRRDLVIETIDGMPAALSPHADALRDAGYRGMGTGLRFFSTP